MHNRLKTFNEGHSPLEPASYAETVMPWATVEMGSGLSHRELMWCVATQRKLRHPAFLQCMRVVSRLGNGVAWYVLIALLALSGLPQGLRAAAIMTFVGVVGLLLYKWLKKTTSRPRPYARNGQVIALTAALDEFSFPSGHTLHAVAFTTVAVAFFPLLAWILVPFTCMVALSRVVLGLHYPSDVLAGASIGASLAITALLWAA